MANSSDSEWQSLLSTPAAVVRYLRKEPLLLAGMGAAVLIAIVAVFAPGGSAVYAYAIAGVVFAACLLWAVSGALRQRAEAKAAARDQPRLPGTDFVAGGRSSVRDVQMSTEGAASSSFQATGRADVQGVVLRSRADAVPEPRPSSEPTQPAPLPDEPALAPLPDEPAPASLRDEAAPVIAAELFVGRRGERDSILGLLSGEAHGAVIDVVGPHGVGKSMLLDRVAVEAAGRPRTIVRRLNLAELVDGHRDDRGADASLAVLVHTLVRSGELLRALAGGAGAELFDDVWARVDDGHRAMPAQVRVDSRVEIRDHAQAQGITIDAGVNLHLSDERVKGEIRGAQAGIDSAFVEAWGRFTDGRRALVTIDSFDRCADDELGHWLVRLALRLPNTVSVLARMPAQAPMEIASERLRHWSLGNFARDEVDSYLAGRLRGTHLDPAVVDLVHEYTGGHPGGVYLLGELVNERDAELLPVRDLRRLLSQLPEDTQTAWASLVDQIVTSEQERSSVRALAVVGSFDQPLLIELLAAVGEKVEPDAASALIGRLRGTYRLLRPVPERHTGFRMHEFVRQAIGQRLRAENPVAWQAMHAAAAGYYFRRLLECEDGADNDGGYQCWYRYENVEWQRLKRAWLHHAGQLVDRRALTRAEFALVFLEAFWWYGCYHPFDFNRRMIEDWERATTSWQSQGTGVAGVDAETRRDEQFGAALLTLLNEYPTGYAKPADAPWEQIGDSLRLIRRISEPPRGRNTSPEHVAAHTRVSALVDVFLAHTCRYADASDPTADRYYAAARAAFADLDDAWTVAWIDLERAELAVERGHADVAQPLLAAAARSAAELAETDEGWDYELVANLHRVRADLHWQRDEVEAAAQNQALAVAHAYWFQGIPHAPDAYTQQFYTEQTDRAARRVLGLVEAGDGARALAVARALAQAIPAGRVDGDAIAAAVDSADRETLAGTLFPAGPTTSELRLQEGTRFMTYWERARDVADEASDPGPQLLTLVGGIAD